MFLAGSFMRPASEFCQVIKVSTTSIAVVEVSVEYVEDCGSDIKICSSNMVSHVLRKHHDSDCCCSENGDFNPTYQEWLGAHKT